MALRRAKPARERLTHVHLPPGGEAQIRVEVEDIQIFTLDGHVHVRIRPGPAASLGTEEQGEMHVLAIPEDLP